MKKIISLVLVLALGLATQVAKADFTFGEPTNLGPTINTSSGDAPDCFSSDGLEMYFSSNRSGGSGGWDIWVTRRPTTDDDWGEPTNLGPKVNGPQIDACACISFDGLELYFNSRNRPGGLGLEDLWVSTRETKNAEWSAPVNLGPIVNSSSSEAAPWISTDGLELYFSSERSGGYGSDDIWVARRATINDPWGPPVNLGPTVNSSADEDLPYVTTDGLSLFFSEGLKGPFRPRGFGSADMWVRTRAGVNYPWGIPVNLGPIVNSSSHDCGPRISPDGSMLYFSSERPGGFGGSWGDIYQAPIIPIVDFNGDEIVDLQDLVILIENWGTNESLCDIGPTPLGDGVVDKADLEVLMRYWQQEVLPVELVAYWKLDETEGFIAQDSAGEYDGTLNGEPLWQPTGGAVDGALEFDGIDDYVSTEFVLDPADGEFSVFAWIKGGAPGQVVISQTGGANWLLADPSEGKLRTSLLRPGGGRTAPQPLISEFIITDGNWHRVGFVWDGSDRILYVDELEVARDTQPGLESSDGGLYLGAGKDLEPGSFFSGLIDDVRIYNRAVTP